MKTLLFWLLCAILFYIFWLHLWKVVTERVMIDNIVVDCWYKTENNQYVEYITWHKIDYISNTKDWAISYFTCYPSFKRPYRLDDTWYILVPNY